MIAAGSENEDSHHHSFFSSISSSTSIGDEPPSLSCDLVDLNIPTNEFEQLLGTFGESPDMPLGMSAANFSFSQCDLTSFFFEDTPRPRDLNLSFPGDSNISPLFDTAAAAAPPPSSSSSSAASSSSSTASDQQNNTLGEAKQSSITRSNFLQGLSRPSSPTWSESSGSVSSSATPSAVPSGRARHLSNEVITSIPRHKRPSHKRAEIKRRDKIKTCLDDIKSDIPSICSNGKLSESTILTKAAEYIHQLKDGYAERGNEAAQLRREIQSLSTEIHSFQENLPAAGLKQESPASQSMDELYLQWTTEHSQTNSRFTIFNSLTSSLFESFKEVVGPAATADGLNRKTIEWQERYLGLPILRKQILAGMLELTRKTSIMTDSDSLKMKIEDS